MAHVPYIAPYHANDPFHFTWVYLPLLPLTLLAYAVTTAVSHVALIGSFMLRGLSVEMWSTPRLGLYVRHSGRAALQNSLCSPTHPPTPLACVLSPSFVGH